MGVFEFSFQGEQLSEKKNIFFFNLGTNIDQLEIITSLQDRSVISETMPPQQQGTCKFRAPWQSGPGDKVAAYHEL